MAQVQANQADLLGVSGGANVGTAGNVRKPIGRPTTPDGLVYTDTGEYTPLYHQRMAAARGVPGYGNLVDTAFRPTQAQQKSGEYKFDGDKGQYYTTAANGIDRLYISNNPSQETAPAYTVNEAPRGGGPTAGQTAANVAGGAAAGSVLGIPGMVGGALLGATQSNRAQGRPLYLTAGDANQIGGAIATPQQAAQANANYLATGNSSRAAPGVAASSPTYTQIQNPYAGQPVATYTPGAGTNGGSALSQEAQRIVQQANQMAQAGNARAQTFYDQAAAAGQRQAPQMAMPSSANQQAVYDRAMNFQADISGAQRLENMQMDMQGINNLESWSPQYSMQGVQNLESFNPTNTIAGMNALSAFNPDATYRSANELSNWRATNTLEGANAVGAFRPELVMEDAEDLRNFQADRSGIDRLNAYADAPEGPSQAQALLRSQADADKRTQLAIARSGRGGPAAQVAAQRQAITEGGLIEAETRGQASALRAAETDAYQRRRLEALAQAGSLISQAEAQRLQGMAAAGQLMSQADAQKLQAVMAYGQLKAEADAQQLSARQAGGQLNAAGDNMVLGAKTAAGQLGASADGQILNARTNAAQLRSTMDAQGLSAISTAAGLRTQADQIRSNNLQAAGNIRIQGSGQNLQALSLAGNISTEMRNQDINVLRSNLDAQLQTLGLNDQQVRFFNQLGNDRENASNNLQMSGAALGLTAQQMQQAQSALDLQWQQFGFQQLTNQQQLQLAYDQMNQQGGQFATNAGLQQQQINNQQAAQAYNQTRQTRNDIFTGLGSAFTAISSLFPTSQGNATAAAAPNFQVGLGPINMAGQPTNPSGYNAMGMVYDPFTGQYVYPSAA